MRSGNQSAPPATMVGTCTPPPPPHLAPSGHALRKVQLLIASAEELPLIMEPLQGDDLLSFAACGMNGCTAVDGRSCVHCAVAFTGWHEMLDSS